MMRLQATQKTLLLTSTLLVFRVFLEQVPILRRILHSVGNCAKHLDRGVHHDTMRARLVSHELLSPGRLWHAFSVI